MEILNKLDLVIGEQTTLNGKIDLLIQQQIKQNENFEKLIKILEEKSNLQ